MTRVLFTFLFAAAFTAASIAGNPDNDGLKVNPGASKIEWTGRKVTGKHFGTVNIKDGSLVIKDGMLTGGSFSVDMTTIKVLDMQGEYAGKLEGHLKSDDFFGTTDHPTAQLVVTQSIAKGNGAFAVKGDLTIKGITQPVNFTAQVMPEGKKYKATANITIDRSLYNVKYGSGKFFENLGDKTIYDEFDLTVTLITE